MQADNDRRILLSSKARRWVPEIHAMRLEDKDRMAEWFVPSFGSMLAEQIHLIPRLRRIDDKTVGHDTRLLPHGKRYRHIHFYHDLRRPEPIAAGNDG